MHHCFVDHFLLLCKFLTTINIVIADLWPLFWVCQLPRVHGHHLGTHAVVIFHKKPQVSFCTDDKIWWCTITCNITQNIISSCVTHRYLSPVSMLANLLQFVGLGIIFYYLLQDLPFTWERKLFATWGQLPLYFGTAIYAFEGIGVVLPLENQMKTPADMKVNWKY